ncbi:GntR family transcriptional regulator [Fodinicola feengrottensis]|uniref:GntR family transcriptional regulator n=1 Tax=Fodinicola feengrottensis TaxID=435914 RepID=UPI00244184DA|nr:GntR family transcriptional regulator [Fodinicola feengrottensis]
MARLGRQPSTKVLEAELVAASAEIAERLGLAAAGDQVVVLERLRLLDGEPCMVERAHLPADLVPGLLDRDLDGSLYDTLSLQYGLVPAQGTESIVAVNADQRLARLLDIPMAAAVLATSRTTSTDSGTHLEYTLRHARGDRCSFLIELGASGGQLGDHSSLDPALRPALFT